MIRAIVHSMRIRQWIKNGVVLAPLVFGGRLLDPSSMVLAGWAVACFCLAASGVYLMNDLQDRRIDRFHPQKKRRPVAAGTLAPDAATALSLCLLLGAVAGGWIIHPHLGIVLALYVGLNLAYTVVLKRLVILDVIALSLGFVLRIWGGAVVLGIRPSHWLQLCMFFLALFLSLAKRRQELVTLHARALRHRGVLADYSQPFIDQLIAILTAVAILCYALYAMSPEVAVRVGGFKFIYTVPFVVYAIFRYLYLIHIRRAALDPTEALVTDRPMLLTLILWIASILTILYR